MYRWILAAALGILITPAAAPAQWFGLELGTERHYAIARHGGTEVARCTTMDVVRGREVFRFENVEQFPDSEPRVYWNYWSVDEQGRLLLHGFKDGPAEDAYGIAYDPPLIFADPEVDATWSITVDRLDFAAQTYIDSGSFNGANYGLTQLSLGIGTFETVVTGFTGAALEAPARAGVRYSVTGRRLPDRASRNILEDSISWWVHGIGEVQYAREHSDLVYSTITFASVPVEENTSGTSQLKSRYLQKD